MEFSSGTSRFCMLSDEQFMAMFLYLKAVHKGDGTLRRLLTPGHIFNHAFDIAGEFNRHVKKNKLLAECYQISMGVNNAETD